MKKRRYKNKVAIEENYNCGICGERQENEVPKWVSNEKTCIICYNVEKRRKKRLRKKGEE